jgi:linoleoyl-CoA desaturase
MPSKLSDPLMKLQFNENNSFKDEVQRRVDEYFRKTGRSTKGNLTMFVKTALILVSYAALYVLLVFFAREPWQAVVLSVLIGFAIAGIGFDIQHDGGHNAYSKHQWINKIMAMTMDMIGGSSYIWKWKHVVFHHRFVNITGYDPDIELMGYGRLSPHIKYKRIYRFQNFYIWALYGILVLKWHLFDDFYALIRGKLAGHNIPRPKGRDLLLFIGGKIVFISLAFAIPMLFHPVLNVLFCYLIAVFELGMLMSVIFQLPHCVEESNYPLPNKETGRMDNPWFIHQLSVTLDFERKNPILTWLLGGLNFHKEHHLLPIICHVHYPAISGIIEQTCSEYNIPYREHKSFGSAVASHYRWIRRMGRPDTPK